MPKWPVHARIDGPIVMIGFGSIGKGTLPLIERHFKFDKSRMTVIDPRDTDKKLLDERGRNFFDSSVEKNEVIGRTLGPSHFQFPNRRFNAGRRCSRSQ